MCQILDENKQLKNPKTIVKLEARCYSWEDALKLVDMLQDITTKKEFADEWVEECSIHYVDPSEVQKEAIIAS